MISVGRAIGLVLGVIGVLLLALLAVTTLQLQTAGERADAESRRSNSFELAERLRQSSNDLTRMVRLYVSTGEARYRDHYREILEIRNGTAARPVAPPLSVTSTSTVGLPRESSICRANTSSISVSFMGMLLLCGECPVLVPVYVCSLSCASSR